MKRVLSHAHQADRAARRLWTVGGYTRIADFHYFALNQRSAPGVNTNKETNEHQTFDDLGRLRLGNNDRLRGAASCLCPPTATGLRDSSWPARAATARRPSNGTRACGRGSHDPANGTRASATRTKRIRCLRS
jgi:hypothetical protein